MNLLTEKLRKRLIDRFIVLRSYQTLREALEAMQHQEGQEFWYLVVEMDDGQYMVEKFAELREVILAEGEAALERPLSDLAGKPLVKAAPLPHDAQDLSEGGTARIYAVEWMGTLIGVIDARRSATSGMGQKPLLELAGLQEPPTGGLVWGDTPAAPSSVEQDIAVGGSVTGDVKVAGGNIIEGNFVQQVFVTQGTQRQVMKEQFRVFEAALPTEVIANQPIMFGVAVYVPGNPSPFNPEEEPRKTTQSDEVAIPMPVDELTKEVQPVDVEISLMAAGFKVSGQATKYLTVWPDGKPAVRWFQLTPEKDGSHIIHVELTYNKRLLQELDLTVEVAKEPSAIAAAVGKLFNVTRVPLQFNFGKGEA